MKKDNLSRTPIMLAASIPGQNDTQVSFHI